MSTVEYKCGYCGDEMGSAQNIEWIDDISYHPNCAPSAQEHDEHVREAVRGKCISAIKGLPVVAEGGCDPWDGGYILALKDCKKAIQRLDLTAPSSTDKGKEGK